jgi:hypothetical protein
VVVVEDHQQMGTIQSQVTTVGLDLVQVHGIDETGAEVLRKRLRRSQVLTFFARLPRCLIGMEACATAHTGRASCGHRAIKSSHAAAVREALREAQQDRRGRRRSDL